MGRLPREVIPGAFYHVTSRGSNREPVFFRPRDRLDFLTMLGGVVDAFEWCCHAYCLMTNHYHLLLQIGDRGLSRGMQTLNGGYSALLSRRYDRVAHLFGNRYAAALIEGDAHLLETCRYVVLNPVRAGMCSSPEEWRWSSFRACAGVDPSPAFLAESDVLAFFGFPEEHARSRYRDFVLEAAA